MDILHSLLPSEPKICYNKNCVVECDSQTLLLPSLVVFFNVCQEKHGKCLFMLQPLVKPTTRHLWSRAFPMLYWEWAGGVMTGEAGVLASPWLAWKPAQTPSLMYPIQPWDAGWVSHCGFGVWNSSVCITEVQIALSKRNEGATEKALLKSAPTSPWTPKYVKYAAWTRDPSLQVPLHLAILFWIVPLN